MSKANTLLQRAVELRPGEFKALAFSFCYFFSLLCAYYIIRPLRDEMGILGGIKNLPWVFSGTFVAILALVPLYGWLSSRYSRRQFLPAVYIFFILNLFIFYLVFLTQSSPHVAQAFFIWVSVFNLFVVSVFWSFMDDIYDKDQSRRLFGMIAAGGTAGAICGPIITTGLVTSVGTHNLLLISMVFLGVAIICIVGLSQWYDTQPRAQQDTSHQRPMGGRWWSGVTLVFQSPYLMGIGVLILMYATLSTFLYFIQANLVKISFADSAERTAVFAMIDLAVNTLTIIIQLFITSRLVRYAGLAWTLALIPILLVPGFISLAVAPVLGVLIVLQVCRRAGNYAVMRPAREMLYVVLGREEKYKAKNFIDTVVYRGGDAISAWAYDGLRFFGLSLSQIAWVAAPLAAIWAIVAYRLGKHRDVIAAQQEAGHDNN